MKKIIVISGATASGKSNLAIELAKELDGVIINSDSMQIYSGLPILSAQPDSFDKELVEHRLYSFLDPYKTCTVFKWLEFVKCIIDNTNKVPVIVGGTGMYISRFINGIKFLPESNLDIRKEVNDLYNNIGWYKFFEIVKGIDEESALKLNKNDKHRIIKIYEVYKITGKKLSYFDSLPNKKLYDNIFHINIDLDKSLLYSRCEDRFNNMLNKMNVIEEVYSFLKKYPDINFSYSISKTIGFREICDYINNLIDYDKMYELTIKSTRNYIKRQQTWFRNQFKDIDYKIKNLEYTLENIIDNYFNNL